MGIGREAVMVDSRFFSREGSLTLKKLATICDAEIFRGEATQYFEDVSPLTTATPQQVAFLHNKKYISDLEKSAAGACILSSDNIKKAPSEMALLVTPTPYRAFAQVVAAFYPPTSFDPTIDLSASIHPTAQIGKGCRLEAGVVVQENAVIGRGCWIAPYTLIGAGVVLGDNCRLESHVTLTYVLIGKNVHIKTGARIGQQGFGFFMEEASAQRGHFSVPQLGRVIIGDHVEIGANTTIDRGSLHDTIIGEWTRIDNQVQIAHNVEIGKGCVLVAQVGIAGSTKIGDFSVLGGQVGVSGHLSLAPGSRVAAKSGVMRDTTPRETIAGIPAVPINQWRRQSVILRGLSKKKS